MTALNKILSVSETEILKESPKNLVTKFFEKNGFFAFSRSLLIRPDKTKDGVLGVDEWNRVNLWKHAYGTALKDVICFAEDIFGEQFCINKTGEIWRFDPEVGELKRMATSIQEWADVIVGNYNIELGYTLGDEWQKKFGSIPNGARLYPIKPFIFGGDYKIDNLYILEDVKGMLLRAEILQQTKHLPDGSLVKVKYTK